MRLKVPIPKREAQRFLTAQELGAVVQAVPDRYRALVLLLGYSGLRIGEATALRVKSLDLMRGRVMVVEAATEVNGVRYVGETKTGNRRTVTLPAFLRDELARHLAEYGNPRDPESLVFTTDDGAPVRYGNFRNRVFYPACKRAGVHPVPRIHHLRHTAVALAISAGAHPKAIQEMVGHSTITTTFNVYGHLFETCRRRRRPASTRSTARRPPRRRRSFRGSYGQRLTHRSGRGARDLVDDRSPRRLLFEIAFYRLSPDAWNHERRGILEPYLAAYGRTALESAGAEPSAADLERHAAWISKVRGLDKPYLYNDAVGWLRLEWDGPGPVVKGYAARVDRERVHRTSPRAFDYLHKVLEVWFSDETSEEIAAAMRDEVVSLTKHKGPFAGRYVDLEAFDTIAPLVDWRRFLGLDR